MKPFSSLVEDRRTIQEFRIDAAREEDLSREKERTLFLLSETVDQEKIQDAHKASISQGFLQVDIKRLKHLLTEKKEFIDDNEHIRYTIPPSVLVYYRAQACIWKQTLTNFTDT